MYKINSNVPSPLMSKTMYVKYMQHWKLVWLDFHRKEFKEEVSDIQEKIFSTGNAIGKLATTHYTDKPISFKRKRIKDNVIETEEALSLAIDPEGNKVNMNYREELPEGYSWVYNTFFESCFITNDGLYAYIDILTRDNNSFKIYEVKSTSKLKPQHIHDVAFQYNVLLENDIKISDVFVSCMNKKYKRGKRKPLKWKGLFLNNNVSERVQNYLGYKGDAKLAFRSWEVYYDYFNSKLGKEYEIALRDYHRALSKNKSLHFNVILKRHKLSTRQEIHNIRKEANAQKTKYYKQGREEYWNSIVNHVQELKELKEEPQVGLGSWLKYPYMCEYYSYLTKDLPYHHVYFLGMAKNRGIKSYHKMELQKEGITSVLQIDRKVMNRYKFSDTQLIEIRENKRAYFLQQKKKGKDVKVKEHGVWNNRKGFEEHYSKLEYPLNFLDFETFSPVLPLAEGHRPHQRLVYQYSLHIQESKNYRNLEHHEFLYDPTSKNKDPERELAEHLIKYMPKKGSVIVYYASFEKSVIRNLADRFEDLRKDLLGIYYRIWDLYTPFELRYHYNAKQQGSASIKKVYPLFQEKMGVKYEDLNVSNGLEATMKYGEALEEERKFENEAEFNDFMFDMLEYCKLDTHAMVILFNKISERLNIPVFDDKKVFTLKKRFALSNLLEEANEIFKGLNRDLDYEEGEEERKASLKVSIEELKYLYNRIASDKKIESYIKNSLKRNKKGISPNKIKEVRLLVNKVPKAKPIFNELLINSVHSLFLETMKSLDTDKLHWSTKKSKQDKLIQAILDLTPRMRRRLITKIGSFKVKNSNKYIQDLCQMRFFNTVVELK